LLWPVNPKADAKDRIQIGAILRLTIQEPARPLAHKAGMHCADEVIGNQGTSGDGTTSRLMHRSKCASPLRHFRN
jgi:hypothetical protein